MNPSSKDQPKIFVSGSSWARGEWVGPKIVHRGMIQYFEDDDYTVIDAGQSRSYHSRVIDHLDQQLTQHYNNNDIVLFVMADPLLDIIMPELDQMHVKRSDSVKNLKNLTEKILEAGGLIALLRKQQQQIYQQLDTVAKQHNVIVNCIGGTYNVNTNLLCNFSNLNALLVSWIDLLIGHLREYPGIGHPEVGVTYTWGIDYVNLDSYQPEFANQVRGEFECITHYSPMLTELIFHPDGLHPNREGHKILYTHLKKLLNL
jgi:lysophospholipase L1-like esterase